MQTVTKLQPKGKPPVVMQFPEDGDVIDIRQAVPVKPAPAVEDVKKDALAYPSRATALVVADQATLDEANTFLKSVKLMAAKIGETFDPLISQAHAHHRSLLAEKKKFTDPLDAAERMVKPKIAAYLDAEDKKRREAERLRAEAEDKARIEAEKAVAKSDKLEAAGQDEKAVQVVEKASAKINEILASAPKVPVEPVAHGLTLTESWKFDVIDAAAVPREFCIPDEKKIGQIVRASKGSMKIPGVRVWSEKSVSSRMF